MLPGNNYSMDYDWYHPRIRFVRVAVDNIEMLGNFKEISQDLVDRAAKLAGVILPRDDQFVYIPVHELQIQNVVSKFQTVEVVNPDISLSALAQSSIRSVAITSNFRVAYFFIRTVVLPDFPGLALKLAVGVKISSSLRTISHFTANFGPRFSADVVPKLAIDPDILSVELETSSAVYKTSDPELAKHFTAVIREEYQVPSGQAVVVCAALLEAGHANIPPGKSAVEHIFGLDTEEKRLQFLDTYVALIRTFPIKADSVSGISK